MDIKISKSTFVHSMMRYGFPFEAGKILFDYIVRTEGQHDIAMRFMPCTYAKQYGYYERLQDFKADYGEHYQSWDDAKKVTDILLVETSYSKGYVVKHFPQKKGFFR